MKNMQPINNIYKLCDMLKIEAPKKRKKKETFS